MAPFLLNPSLKMNSCPICTEQFNNDHVLHFQQAHKSYTLLKCPACECLFYKDNFVFDFKNNIDHNKSLKIYLEKNADIEGLVTLIYNFLSQLPKATKGIDIGCGAGLVMDFAAAFMTKEMIGFEPSLYYSREGKENLNLNIIDDFFSSDYLQDDKQDFAICLQVLQMSNSPATLLKDIFKSLNNNGILLLTTPDNNVIHSDQDILNNLPALSPGVHRIIYSETSLIAALKNAGFKHVKVYKRNNTLFALASPGALPDIDLFLPNRDIVVQYYELKLTTLEKNSSYYKGIWYRYFRNKIDYGEYDSALQILLNTTWFEVWSENEIEEINSYESLFELNTFSDAIIYYYIGILLLNYLQRTHFSEKFFLLSYLLCKKIIQIQPENCPLESDILWHAKLNYLIAKTQNGQIAEVKNELIAFLTIDKSLEKLPTPSVEIKKLADAMLKNIA